MQKSPNFTRRDFLKFMFTVSAQLALLSFGGAFYGTQVETAWIEVVRQIIRLPRLHPAFDGFRFTQISDIHMGGWMNRERFANVIELVKKTNPELVLITGDFVEYVPDFARTLVAIQDVRDVLASLSSLPTLAILGNQDYRGHAGYFLRDMLSTLKIVDMTNRIHTLTRGDGQLYFVGLDDILMGFPDFEGMLADLPQDGTAILLAHEPDFADIASLTSRFDLQISGHSHGGQVVLPVIGPPVLPSLGKKYVSGLYQVGKMYQYTNRGVGTTEPYIRINCRPEITVFTLRAA